MFVLADKQHKKTAEYETWNIINGFRTCHVINSARHKFPLISNIWCAKNRGDYGTNKEK